MKNDTLSIPKHEYKMEWKIYSFFVTFEKSQEVSSPCIICYNQKILKYSIISFPKNQAATTCDLFKMFDTLGFNYTPIDFEKFKTV